ncbi:MAG TPA: hypothetical protein PKE29_13450 [Phycisphaerales bacterium]|nr:hypothetical protein [Phycisphaerales bacterium]
MRRLPPTRDPTARVIATLRELGCNPRTSGAGWCATCPTHEDSAPSLSITIGDNGATLLKCHAGCTVATIADMLGMRLADLFPADERGRKPAPGSQPTRRAERARPAQDWPELADAFARAMPDDRLGELSVILGVSREALTRLNVGWADEPALEAIIKRRVRGPAWVFPMRSGGGEIIGLCARGRDGSKWTLTGGRLGLFGPADLASMPDPVIVPEGASDTAAALSVGWTAVGRPSNRCGVEHLVESLRGRRVVILGENDEKPDGKWPGREGAVVVANALARAWQVRVPWRLPPAPHKDLRAWLGVHPNRAALANSMGEVLKLERV